MAPTSRADMSNKKMLRILLQEIADVRRELKEEIDQRFGQMDQGFSHMNKEFSALKSDIKGLRFQLHQNHTSFITNQGEMEKRIAVLETAA